VQLFLREHPAHLGCLILDDHQILLRTILLIVLI
jgi:hypothetical protein